MSSASTRWQDWHIGDIFCHTERDYASAVVIAFPDASPFELLDLTGPAAVFSIPSTKGKHNYSLQSCHNVVQLSPKHDGHTSPMPANSTSTPARSTR